MTDTHAQNERNLATVKALYDAAGRGDEAATKALLTEDFSIFVPASLPHGGTYHGREALRPLFEKALGLIGAVGFEVHAMTSGDNHVVAILSLLTAEGGKIRIAESFRMVDGLIAEIVPYYLDTQAVAAHIAARAA